MPEQPMLEEAAIRERVGETSFALGVEYTLSGGVPRRGLRRLESPSLAC